MPIQENKIEYSGDAKAEKGHPKIELIGKAKFSFSENGERTMEMDVTDSKYESPYVVMNGDFGNFERIQLEDASGTFEVVDGNVFTKSTTIGAKTGMVIEFLAKDGVYMPSVGKGLEPKYWRISLVNCVTHFMERKPQYDSHPLADKKRGKIYFTYRGNEVFIEPIQDYDECVKALKEDGDPRITATMVGEIKKDVDLDKYLDWLPMDSITFLGMVTESRTSISWVEMFDMNGVLIRRSHPNYIVKEFKSRSPVINEVFDRSLGQFLTTALLLENQELKMARVCCNQIISSREATYIEEKISCLTQSLDRVSKGKKIIEDLGGGKRKTLSFLTDFFTFGIRVLAKISTNENEREALETFGFKAKDLLNAGEGFSKKLERLLNEHQLLDFEVMKNVNLKHKRKKLKRIIDYYRNIVAHEGSISSEDEDYDLGFVYKIVVHLEDILIRVLFKKMGYRGKYQPRTIMSATTDTTAEWVTASTSPKQLGYEEYIV